MSRPMRHFKILFILGIVFPLAHSAFAAETGELKKDETGLYQNFFDQNIYYEGTHYLRFEDLARAISHKKLKAQDVNVFDEVPDSAFFTNRQGRKKLTAEELEKGYQEGGGPDLTGKLTIVGGKFEDVHPGFFVKDSKGEEYFIQFDPSDHSELVTSAEVITSRFYHAIGYNVSEYNLIIFPPDRLVAGADALVIDNTGFKRRLTRERLEKYLLFIPWDAQGNFRASARKIFRGEDKGNTPLTGRRKADKILRENRRAIRALRVFGSWLNHDDIREENTRDVVGSENGTAVLKHDLLNFSSSLGAQRQGAKPPELGYEHLLDYGEITKSFLSLGIWEKPWQKRWKEAGEEANASAAIGYFDNHYFDPGKYKNQLPYYAFKNLTRADGFWAAKIIMSFSDEDIKAMVKAGQFSQPSDADFIVKTLAERRDMIGRYWFAQVNPLENFEYKDKKLSFEDLTVNYKFESGEAVYSADVAGKKGSAVTKITSLQSKQPAFDVDPNWFSRYDEIDFWIRTLRPGAKKASPYVLISLKRDGIASIRHED